MAIDVRADVNCSLGTLISASVSDSYVQETGLVFATGNAVINGIITPAPGTIVTFSYTKDGITRTLPRKLRVLSSFADPFRRTTSVELGCKLTYLKDLKPAPTVDGEPEVQTGKRQQCLNGYIDFPANSPYGVPIRASGLMDTCLARLGISASSNPLTNSFYREQFEFTSGYVSVLGDLLVSESYFGYLDINETLQVISLDQQGGSGPVIDSSNIIDISGVAVGDLPADAVVVRYDSLKLNENLEDEDETILSQRDWTEDITVGELESVSIRWTSGSSVLTSTASYRPETIVISEYGIDDSWNEDSCVIVDTNGEGADLSNTVVKRTTTKTVLRAIQATDYVGRLLSIGAYANLLQQGFETKVETYEFNNSGDIIRQVTEEYEPFFSWVGRINIELFYGTQYVSLTSSPVLIKKTIVETEILYAALPTYIKLNPGEKYEKLSNGSKIVTSEYVNWVLTQQGNNGVAGQNANAAFTNTTQATTYLNEIANKMVLDSTTVQISRDRVLVGIQRRPPIELRLGSNGANFRGEYKAELLYTTGSPLSARIIEFSMPYQSDDYYSPTGAIIKGDASAKASRYGRAQNRLLLGSRNGMNIQLEPELLPSAPFSPIIIQANGLSALYRTNGSSWTMDSNGILVSTDALFWGAVGGTGVFWFPVAPGIVTLPSTPPVVDGQMNVSTVVPPYNEISVYNASIGLRNDITKFNYTLELLTSIPVVPVKVVAKASRVIGASKGTYSLTGRDSLPRFPSRVLGAQVGNYLLGGPQTFFKPHKLVANIGGYTISGIGAGFVVPIGIRTGTAVPLLGANSATTYTGWTRLQNENSDDDFLEVTGWPLSFTINSISYTSGWVGANTFITFGAGDYAYNSLSASNPYLPKIMFGSDDNSYQRVYTRMDTAADASPIVRIRYEGAATRYGTVGASNIIAEFTFFTPRSNGDQWVELRVGTHARTTGPFLIAKEDTSYASATIAANTSWVFVGNSTGTAWTMTSNRYIS